MTERANVFVKAKHMCRYLFEKSRLTRDRLFGVDDGENDFAAIQIAVIELFPDSIDHLLFPDSTICQEKR